MRTSTGKLRKENVGCIFMGMYMSAGGFGKEGTVVFVSICECREAGGKGYWVHLCVHVQGDQRKRTTDACV